MKYRNPLAFRTGPVTFWTSVVYLAVIIPLIYVHEVVPPAPKQHRLREGLNLTEAWQDLQAITRTYHPYNSRQNDEVRQFIINRSKEILDRNHVHYTSDSTGGVQWQDIPEPKRDESPEAGSSMTVRPPGATLFDDQTSNVTYTYEAGSQYGSAISGDVWMGQYFEGNNFYVYIHGTDDPEGQWWLSEEPSQAFLRNSAGVLVNCHFDSVATGYGATDDGVACVTMLQMLSYYTSEGRQPKNGIVLLFNNAEEDGLFGARVFAYSPLLKFIHTFVNLEGAGAGGRAILFRATDLQAAESYSGVPHPFGSIVAANAFERGVIRSGTDYQVFHDVFGQRGVDVAFYAPRSRYHTEEDDARHTSVDSIWHMLSAALASTDSFSQRGSTTFTGNRADGRRDLVQNGKPIRGVWFDWFGRSWTTFPLRGLFAWSLTLLVVTPLVLLIVTYVLIRQDKYYFFANDVKTHLELGDDPVPIGGWRGFTRFPLAFVFASGLTIASVLLVAKFNPLIVYSSGYSIWAMTLTLFYFSFWLIARGSSFVRPSALHRGFALVWLFILTWILQVFAAVAEDRMQIGALYFAAFLHSAVFVALLISLLEQFALPGKEDFARQFHDAQHQQEEALRTNDGAGSNDGTEEQASQTRTESEDNLDAATPTERTPLRASEQGYGSNDQTTFASRYRQAANAEAPPSPDVRSYPPYDHEQSWSGRLPSWTWIIQFLLLVPLHVILLGNQGLLQMTSTSMTGADGGSLLMPVLSLGLLSILLLLPLTPFLHRVTHHIPLFFLLVFIGTFIYNLVAFPFSINHRYKLNFQQVIDLDNSTNIVTLSGIEEFLHPVLSSLPSAAGKHIECRPTPGRSLKDCDYDAASLPPRPVKGEKLEDLIKVTTSKATANTALVQIEALETRTCYLDFSRPIYGFSVEGGGSRDDRFGSLPKDGLQHLQIWRRSWEGAWNVVVDLTGNGHLKAEGASSIAATAESNSNDELKVRTSASKSQDAADNSLDVTVRCAWSDANKASNIPAFTELLKYMPKWAIVTKRSVGLVEVKKTFKVPV